MIRASKALRRKGSVARLQAAACVTHTVKVFTRVAGNASG